MSEKPDPSRHSAAERTYGSDFAKIDAHEVTAEEYDEIPEFSDDVIARGVPGNGEDIARRARGRPRLNAPKR